ncbi:hypothetical protein FKM82_003142 [Ascaphus truei]
MLEEEQGQGDYARDGPKDWPGQPSPDEDVCPGRLPLQSPAVLCLCLSTPMHAYIPGCLRPWQCIGHRDAGESHCPLFLRLRLLLGQETFPL